MAPTTPDCTKGFIFFFFSRVPKAGHGEWAASQFPQIFILREAMGCVLKVGDPGALSPLDSPALDSAASVTPPRGER